MIYSTLKNLSKLVLPAHRKKAAGLVVLLIISAFFESIGLGLILPLIGLMTAPDMILQHPYLQPLMIWLGQPSADTAFFIVLGSLNIVFALTLVYRMWLSWSQTAFLNQLKIHTATSLFSTYMHQKWSFYLANNSATLIQNVSREVDLITQYGYAGALTLAREIIFIAVIGVMLVLVIPSTAIIAILSLLPLAWVFQKLSRLRVKLWAEKRQETETTRLKNLQESFSLIKELRLASKENAFIKRFDLASQKLADIELKQSFMRNLTRPIFELYALVSVSGAILILWHSGMKLAEISPILGLFALAILKLLPSLNQILIALHGMRYIQPVIATTAHDMALPALPPASTQLTPFNFRSHLRFIDVTYQHSGAETPILNHIDLSIGKGEFIGIIGATGTGKSTIIDLILGLLTTTAGQIRVDDLAIDQNLRGWQTQIGYVGQTITLLDDTIRHNIAMAIDTDQINPDQINQALQAAQLDRLIMKLPDGLETKIGERGTRLSGGERQRLGIARALYHNPPILILDEATSALDQENEALVMQAVESLKGHKTIIMITHRHTTLKKCDRVFTLRDGQITASDPVQSD